MTQIEILEMKLQQYKELMIKSQNKLGMISWYNKALGMTDFARTLNIISMEQSFQYDNDIIHTLAVNTVEKGWD